MLILHLPLLILKLLVAHRNLTKDLIMNESIKTTEPRAKEVRKFVDKMITYGKDGSLVARRKALAFLQNDNTAVKFSSFLILIFLLNHLKY